VIDALAALGFGFVEVGTVTPRPQPGNDRPRMFRLSADDALINRLGFNSAGARVVAAHLAARPSEAARRCVLGLNLGKNRETPLAGAAADYALALRRLGPVGDYLVVNVSSPNTPGLRDLQAAGMLRGVVESVRRAEEDIAGAAGRGSRPVLVKLAPDLDDASLDASLDAAAEAGAAGFLAANTTVARPESLRSAAHRHEAGGLSGAPLFPRTLEVVTRAFRRFDGRLPVVGVGGVSDGERAWRLVRAGASLVQAYTGFVYGGPGFPRRVLRALVALLDDAGARTIADVVGADA